jgi:hypothetical protein
MKKEKGKEKLKRKQDPFGFPFQSPKSNNPYSISINLI